MQNNLLNQYKIASPAVKLIVINVAVFIVYNLITFLFKLGDGGLAQWVILPSNFADFISKPWTLYTYAFFHFTIDHVFFNMVMLYFSGTMFFQLGNHGGGGFFTGKQFYSIYFLGALCGGLLFLLSYNMFPVFAGANAVLLGASAAVMAILIFVCTVAPNMDVRLFFVLNVKLWHVALLFVVLDLLQMSWGNAGGHIAHLGGALLGYVYAKQLRKNNDIGAGFSGMLDAIANLFKSGSSKVGKRTQFKKVYRNKKTKPVDTKVFDNDKNLHQKKVDAILDKISKSGYESLTKEEKDFLFRDGKN